MRETSCPLLIFHVFACPFDNCAHCTRLRPPHATQQAAINYWVSTSGDDSAKGSASAPFVTINRAQLAVRHNKLRGLCTIYVNIRAGVYSLSAPLTFDPLDSGSVEQPESSIRRRLRTPRQ